MATAHAGNPAAADETLALLADVAASFATPDPDRVRRLRDADSELDREMWGRIAENGWLSIQVPDELGGAGLGLDAVAIVARALGFAGFPEPFAAAGVLTPHLLAEAGGSGDRLAAVIAGEVLVGVGWRDQDVTERDGALEGSSRFIGFAGADAYLVAARGPDGTAIHWVDATADGLTVSRERRADGGLSAALELAGVGADPLLPAPAGGDALGAALDAARVATAAELVGLGERALELTLEHLRGRVQFGQPIGAFQALQHRAVDAWMQLELASAALESALAVFADPDADGRARAAAASSAKARAATAVPLVCRTALQLHGAIGFTDEYELGLHINRSLTLAPWLGNAAEHTRRWAELTEAAE